MIEISSYTGGIAETNGWLLQTDSGALAVDAPEGFNAWLKTQNIKLDALLLTHQHFDHVMDAAQIKAAHGCPILAFAEYSKSLTLEELFGAATDTSFVIDSFEVDQQVANGEIIELAGAKFKVLHIPGHSSDSVCFHASEHQLLFGGDVLFSGSIGRTDLPGGSTNQLLEGIKAKLMVLDDKTRVLPGHGPETSIGEERMGNPFLV